MGKLFGTDGIRGVVRENLTADLAFRVGPAMGTVLTEEKGGERPTVVLGKDTRISSDMLEAALITGLWLRRCRREAGGGHPRVRLLLPHPAGEGGRGHRGLRLPQSL